MAKDCRNNCKLRVSVREKPIPAAVLSSCSNGSLYRVAIECCKVATNFPRYPSFFRHMHSLCRLLHQTEMHIKTLPISGLPKAEGE